MTLTTIRQGSHTSALIIALETIDGLTGVGRGIRNTAPNGTDDELGPPCIVVHPLPGGARYGTLDDHQKHADLSYQLTCHGETAEQAEWVRDEAEEVLAAGLTVAGRRIEVIKLDFGSSEAQRDDTLGEPWFTSRPRIRLRSLG